MSVNPAADLENRLNSWKQEFDQLVIVAGSLQELAKPEPSPTSPAGRWLGTSIHDAQSNFKTLADRLLLLDQLVAAAEKAHGGAITLTSRPEKLLGEIETQRSTLETLAKQYPTDSPEWVENRRLHCEQAGEWARHYSTVRMTISTFVITTCVAIIALKWGDVAERAYIGNAIAVLWLLGLVIFEVFTFLTFDRLHSQMKNLRNLPVSSVAKNPKTPLMATDGASIALWVLTLLFAFFGFVVAEKAILCPLKWALLLAPPWALLYALKKDAALAIKHRDS